MYRNAQLALLTQDCKHHFASGAIVIDCPERCTLVLAMVV